MVTAVSPGLFRAGIAMEDARKEQPGKTDDFEGYYETLEVNPTASFDTIHKIYRVLAQRIHPDNPDSGSEEGFKRLVEWVSDLVGSRAAGRIRCREVAKIIETVASLRCRLGGARPGAGAAKAAGDSGGPLQQRMRWPENCGVTIPELEQLCCPAG